MAQSVNKDGMKFTEGEPCPKCGKGTVRWVSGGSFSSHLTVRCDGCHERVTGYDCFDFMF